MSKSSPDPIPFSEDWTDSPRSAPGLWSTPGYRWLWLVLLLLGSGYGATISSQSTLWDEAGLGALTTAWIVLGTGIGALLGYLIAALTADRCSKQSLVTVQALIMAGLSAISVVIVMVIDLSGEWFVALSGLFGLSYGLSIAVMYGWTCELLPRTLIAKGVVVLALAGYAQTLVTTVPGVVFSDDENAVKWLFGFAFVMYLLGGVAARRVPRGSHLHAPESAIQGFRHAVSYVWKDVRLQSLWLYALFAGVIMALMEGAILDLIWDVRGLRDWRFVLPFGVRGAAWFVATVSLLFLIRSRHRWLLFISSGGVLGLATAMLAVATDIALLTLLFALLGLSAAVVTFGFRALAFSVTASGFFGRVAALMLLAGGVFSFGASFLRILFDDLFVGHVSVLIYGVLFALLAAWLYMRWRRFRDMPEDPDAVAEILPVGLLMEAGSPQKASEPGQSD